MSEKDDEDINLKNNPAYSKICFLSNFPPKECGIATFTRDLVFALDKKFNPMLKSRVIALNENTDFYNYGNKVIMQLNKDYTPDYINTAKKINKTKNIKLICIQHEFGLFGGEHGSHLLSFLETIEKPVVITFHSVLPNPDEKRKKVVQIICSKCLAIVVMANAAIDILNNDYGVDREKIHFIPHGIPNASLNSTYSFKKKLRLNNKIILSTFGLLSRGKGVEHMIKALPKLVEKYPNILYLVIGETHPVIRKQEGEKYRNELIALIEELGLKNHIKFYNKYLTIQEIVHYILATDIYVCTNLEKNQIVSGTLSYALGCGKAVVSTPSIYAEEILKNERGLLTNFKDSDSFSESIDRLLSDKELKNRMEKNAYLLGRSMTWQNVASLYLNIFNKIVKLREEITEKFPPIKLGHLRKLTDDFGCIQFSKVSTPDKTSGYTVDDNSRALIAAVLHNNLFNSRYSLNLAKTYLNFLKRAQGKNGYFINNFQNENEILDPCSEDAFGRAIWSLGYTIYKSKNQEIIEKVKKIFDLSYRLIKKMISPRTKSFVIAGLYYYHKKYRDQKSILEIKKLADSLINSYKKESSDIWQWFEPNITYSNSKLPEALFLAYDLTKNEKYLEVAEKTLNFLSSLVFINNELAPVGQKGWCNKYGKRAFFDQQPVDASCIVQTLLIAYSITKNKEDYKKAILAFNWFLGKNYLKQMVYNEITGGCYDGLSKDYINPNQGAESTISYLLARLMLEEVKREEKKGL